MVLVLVFVFVFVSVLLFMFSVHRMLLNTTLFNLPYPDLVFGRAGDSPWCLGQ